VVAKLISERSKRLKLNQIADMSRSYIPTKDSPTGPGTAYILYECLCRGGDPFFLLFRQGVNLALSSGSHARISSVSPSSNVSNKDK
jgi:hypothetical protein